MGWGNGRLPNQNFTIRKDHKGHKGNAVIAAIADNAENAKIESAIRLCTRWDLAFPALTAVSRVIFPYCASQVGQ
jgi:hypothetical protein